MGRVAGAAHGNVGELSATAVGEHVRPVDGRALHAVDGEGVRVVEPVLRQLVAHEQLATPVVESDLQRIATDTGDGGPFAGDVPAVRRGGEGDDAVAGRVSASAGCLEVGAGDVACAE